MSRHVPLRLALPLLLALGLPGCVTYVSAPAPEPAPEPPAASGDGQDAASPEAPLLPSALFPGEAAELVGWRCTPAQDLVTATTEDELRLWSAHGANRLEPAVVASGNRYQNGELGVWLKGDEALVESQRGRLDCRQDVTLDALTRQEHPGVMFHGRGNEPGWHVELANDVPELTMTLDYGRREATLPYRVTTLDNQAGRVILASGQAARPFTLRIEAKACFDDMSGQPWPARVTLKLNGETYRGCGQGIAP
ncbi:COG3650 family protein [Halomonas koreensis]|uniref:MliC family protein n=1 Tax=Halomonas koreensis TaxID=245385 RepID=A0ABU1FX52_9GAMM|nr:MliC family protein [Halomonas koreensis]MDR5865209.1 MliC family protein [Halomonas koreensis]